MKKEAQVLADMMDSTRQLSFYYWNKLQEKDIYKTFECNGAVLNNAFWVMAHLAVTENFLLLRSTGGEMIKFSWAKQFGLGAALPLKEECPPLQEMIDTLNFVHQKSLLHLSQLSDEDLEKPTITGVKFGGEDSIRSIIMHAIRHEGTHAGHLGWLCKLHGIKTI
jgi:uncharacterized damage-inducible protein DinB